LLNDLLCGKLTRKAAGRNGALTRSSTIAMFWASWAERSMGETLMPAAIADHARAGTGGLAAAKAVAPYFEKVTVLDRDALPEGPEVRAGTPQTRHAHALLAGGERALEALFPGIASDLLAPAQPKDGRTRDAGRATRVRSLPAARPSASALSSCPGFLLESHYQRRVRDEPNVELRWRSRAAFARWPRCRRGSIRR
jgi:hypothetical protein